MTQNTPPSSLRAHLLQATHAWLTEGGHTPYIQVLVDSHVQVPPEYVQDGTIILNASYDSTNRLHIDAHYIRFQARFAGQVQDIVVPLDHIVSLFSKETQEGYQAMTAEEFIAIREGHYQPPVELTQSTAPAADAAADPAQPAPEPPTPTRPASKKPTFTRVK